MVWFCKNCKENNMPPIGSGYMNLIYSYDKKICPQCGNPLVSVPLTGDDLYIITDISHDSSFLEAMIDLKHKDPIEFQLKISQFKATQNQTKTVEESTGPHCPYCSSADLKKISGLSKAGSVALWGIFAVGKVSKQWHCNSCKSDF